MHFSWFDVLVLVGIIQGVITSVLLFSQKPRPANSILPWMLLVTVVLNGKILIHTLGLWNTPLFRYFPLALDLAIQPLVYLYVVSITQARRNLVRLAVIHLSLPALLMGHALLVYSQVLSVDNLAAKVQLAAYFRYDTVKQFEDYLSVLSFILYTGLAIRQLHAYRRWLNDTVSDASYPTYTWLRNLLRLMGGLTALLGLNIVLDYGFHYGQTSFLHWQLFYLLLTVIIYYIGVRGYQQTVFPQLPTTSTALVPKPEPLERVPVQKIQLIQADIRRLLKEETIYRDPTLTVSQLARQLNLSPNLISYTLSQSFGKSFRDLINEYRVEEVKQRLGDPTWAHLSILGIALESGFNSEASFYRIFKKHTGQSPKAYQLTKA